MLFVSHLLYFVIWFHIQLIIPSLPVVLGNAFHFRSVFIIQNLTRGTLIFPFSTEQNILRLCLQMITLTIWYITILLHSDKLCTYTGKSRKKWKYENFHLKKTFFRLAGPIVQQICYVSFTFYKAISSPRINNEKRINSTQHSFFSLHSFHPKCDLRLRTSSNKISIFPSIWWSMKMDGKRKKKISLRFCFKKEIRKKISIFWCRNLRIFAVKWLKLMNI